MKKLSLINGVFSENISVFDRGLAYGDGLFETMSWQYIEKGNKKNQVEFWKRHLNRISFSCKRLKINFPKENILQNYKDKILNKANRLGIKKGILKLLITRGEGMRGYKFEKNMNPTIIFLAFPFSDYSDDFFQVGVTAEFCESYITSNRNLAGLKHLNRLDSVLARAEWNNEKIFEGMFIDEKKNIVEGTMTNIFFVKGKTLFTPRLLDYGINGIMREVVLENYDKFFDKLKITEIKKTSINEFDQMFLTNSLLKIVPVRKIGKHKYSIFDNTRRIIEHYQSARNLEFS